MTCGLDEPEALGQCYFCQLELCPDCRDRHENVEPACTPNAKQWRDWCSRTWLKAV